jgi:thiol-disulfide isomerase/thioredoxin
MKKAVLFLITLLLSSSSFAQKNKAYELKFKVKGVKDTTVYLANYFGEKLFYKDTAFANSKGEFVFDGTTKLPTGKYAVVTPGPRFFEIFIEEQRFYMETDTVDFNAKMQIKDSPNNKLLYDYIHFIVGKKKESEKLSADLAIHASDPEKSKAITQRLVDMNDEVMSYQKQTVAANPNLIAAKALNLMIPVNVPETPKREDGSIDSLWGYRYYYNHFLDHADLNDSNMVRLPEFHKKLEEFMNKVVIQNPDSINVSADRLLKRVKNVPELYKYVVHYITTNAQSSKMMGMDAVYVHMADNYYLQGKTPWADSTAIANMKEQVDRIKPTLIGKITPRLTLMDTLGTWIDLYDIKAKYTILFFYDPDCGHCKKQTPVLIDLLSKNKEKSIAVYAVSGDTDDKWNKFIREKGLHGPNIYNVAAPQKVYSDSKYATELILQGKTDYGSLNYRTTYDIFSTPKVLLVDSDKKILAKQIGIEQVFEIIDNLDSRKSK